MSQKNVFQAEVKKVLDLMIHSVYSNKEIFLRELISNASDAIDKRRFQALSQPDLAPAGNEYKIQILPQPDKKTLTIRDNGIGMSYEEVVENIGTIAKSGTKDFSEMTQQMKENPELIGQFGVGFYSTFMVSHKVSLLTRKAGTDKATLWESSGDGTYTVSESSKDEAGTEITLELKETTGQEDDPHFFEEWTIKRLITKYSDFIAYPIQLEINNEWVTLNSMKALWTRNPSEVKKEDYTEFYRQLGHDWNEPQKVIHYKAEGNIEFTSLLFIPSKKPYNFNAVDAKRGLNLYVKKVFIMDHSKDLIPDYLRFISGMVDSADLSLNISRELLQQNAQVTAIRKNVVTKVLNTLGDMLRKERTEYENVWNNFGSVLKEGMATDEANHTKITDLLLFHTTKIEGLSTLKEYVERMKPDQKEIYFLTGESLEQLKRSPLLEKLKEKDIEVILMDEDIDEWVVSHLDEYQTIKLQSAAKGDLNFATDEEKKEIEKETTEYKDVIDILKEALKEQVKEVRVSSRLKDSPVVLVNDDADMSANMQRIISSHRGDIFKPKRILEINPRHAIFAKMKSAPKADQGEWAELFYGQALLTEGSQLPDPVKFSQQINKLMLT